MTRFLHSLPLCCVRVAQFACLSSRWDVELREREEARYKMPESASKICHSSKLEKKKIFEGLYCRALW